MFKMFKCVLLCSATLVIAYVMEKYASSYG